MQSLETLQPLQKTCHVIKNLYSCTDLSQSGQAYVELESSKSKAMDVIDLTADSSDDETVINAKSPPRVASDTPVSISSS